MRWRCGRCGTEFDEIEDRDELRAFAADFYDDVEDPDELDDEDLATIGGYRCGYAGDLMPASSPRRERRRRGVVARWRDHEGYGQPPRLPGRAGPLHAREPTRLRARRHGAAKLTSSSSIALA